MFEGPRRIKLWESREITFGLLSHPSSQSMPDPGASDANNEGAPETDRSATSASISERESGRTHILL